MRIAFVHYPGRLERLSAARAGEGPTEFLFGAVELERAGHEVSHFAVDPTVPAGGLARRAIDLQAGKERLPPHLAAAVLRQTRELLPALRDADVVVATTTGTAVALGTWRRLGRLRTPLVGIVAGLVNRPWSATRRRTTLPVLRSMHSVLYGPGELGGLVALDEAALAGRVHVNRFGVDTSFWSPGADSDEGKDKGAAIGAGGDGGAGAALAIGNDEMVPATGNDRKVLAIGNDGNRDWATFVQAAPAIDARVQILTSHPKPGSLPPNVAWEPADWHRRLLSDDAVREAYRGADVVVVPVRDVPQPSGQSVTLQALACGCPVVLTHTRGTWDDRLDAAVRLVSPADPDGLAGAVGTLLANREDAAELGRVGRAWVEQHASVEGFAERLAEICRHAIAAP